MAEVPSKPTPKNSHRYKKSRAFKTEGGKRYVDGVLNPQQARAVEEFFKNNGKQEEALLAAGYSPKTAKHCPHSVFSHPAVRAEIERRRRLAMEKAEITEEWVLRKLAKLANAPEILAKFRKVSKDGMLYYDFRGATEAEIAVITELSIDTYMDGKGDDAREVKKMKVGITDPKAALDSIARILGLNKDKVSHDVEINLVERLHAGRKRLRLEHQGGSENG